jgi:hypothetical protein
MQNFAAYWLTIFPYGHSSPSFQAKGDKVIKVSYLQSSASGHNEEF